MRQILLRFIALLCCELFETFRWVKDQDRLVANDSLHLWFCISLTKTLHALHFVPLRQNEPTRQRLRKRAQEDTTSLQSPRYAMFCTRTNSKLCYFSLGTLSITALDERGWMSGSSFRYPIFQPDLLNHVSHSLERHIFLQLFLTWWESCMLSSALYLHESTWKHFFLSSRVTLP